MRIGPDNVPMCFALDEDTGLACELEDGHDGVHEATMVWEDDEGEGKEHG